MSMRAYEVHYTTGNGCREKQATRHEERAFLCPLVNLIKICYI
ncbi:Uncharacterised protein [Campylobacter gracilis]|nr:Uncharacterised protein [Campylobacter gracilis]